MSQIFGTQLDEDWVMFWIENCADFEAHVGIQAPEHGQQYVSQEQLLGHSCVLNPDNWSPSSSSCASWWAEGNWLLLRYFPDDPSQHKFPLQQIKPWESAVSKRWLVENMQTFKYPIRCSIFISIPMACPWSPDGFTSMISRIIFLELVVRQV